MVDLNEIASKWQKEWENSRIFEADADASREKFFAHFTYPYVNAYPHIGHFYTLMQADIMARFKRLRGFNVMMPQGWHATGSPIISAAQRVKEKEEKQIKMMRDMGITDENELKKFEEPKYWIDFFAPEFRKDFEMIGASIDWRRNYITTSLNPHYDKFIRWQFRKLKEKNYVIKGRFPVAWCPKENAPVGDHDRVEGEGETPQEFVVMKYIMGDKMIATATLRPETLYGDTNLWINPDVYYVVVKIGEETLIMSSDCAEKLAYQEKAVSVESEIQGSELVGKYCKSPYTGKELMILPSSICDPKIGTGIVRSVPSHAPFDWAALNDIQNDEKECAKFGIDFSEIRKIKPISVISIQGMGEHPAAEIAKKAGVKSQKDTELLDKATKELYKKEFFSGLMKDINGPHKGKSVAKAKEEMRQEMMEKKTADIMYELTGKIVCRCLTPSIIKIVSDQWFIAYGNRKWKKQAHDALKKLRLYPEKARSQLEYTIDWLRDWACTREKGLGTRLPWDEKWLIESLSDSTIYFAFYPIAHIIQKINPDLIDDAFFDYVMLGKGSPPSIENIEQMKKEFEYWYPFDFNTSGKDLIQNHIAFSLFNHAAIFPEDKWPSGLRVNGWVTIDDQKMSKSLGNIILLRSIAKQFSPDAARIAIVFAGEGLNDPNWDSEFANSVKEGLIHLHDFSLAHHGKGTKRRDFPEIWLESQTNAIIKTATEWMESGLFRSSLQLCYFDFQKSIRIYLKLTNNNPDKKMITNAIETQLILLSPFAPFIVEEIWHQLGMTGFASQSEWPYYDKNSISPRINYFGEVIESTKKDIYAVIKLSKKEPPKKITLFIAEEWKYPLMDAMKRELEGNREINVSKFLKGLIKGDFRAHTKEVSALVPQLVKNKSRIPEHIADQQAEMRLMNIAIEMYKEELKTDFEVVRAEASDNPKAKNALPMKAAILVE